MTKEYTAPKLTEVHMAERLKEARALVARHARDPNADSPEVLHARQLVDLFGDEREPY